VSIPKEWLQRRTTVADVEAGFAHRPPVGRWLEDWRALVAAMRPGDELWEYCSSPESWQHLAGRAGYAVVREGEVVDGILTIMN
jgi:hypothetical protein